MKARSKTDKLILWGTGLFAVGYWISQNEKARRLRARARCIGSPCVRDKVDQGMSVDEAIEECCD